MPTTPARTLKNALSLAAHALDRQAPTQAGRTVFLVAAENAADIVASGPGGCAHVRIPLGEFVEGFDDFAMDLECASRWAECLPSIGVQRLSFSRDGATIAAIDGVTAPIRAKRLKHVRLPANWSDWFDPVDYLPDSNTYSLCAQKLVSPLVTMRLAFGPQVRVRTGIGASPLVAESARPDLGSVLCARFALFPTLAA